MKKIFSTILLLATAAMVLTGCKSEEDDLFSSSAAERLTESQNTYTQRLGGTTWLMEYYPLGTTDLDPDTRDPYPAGLGYVILNRFKTDGSVEQAMNNSATDYKYVNDVSLWEVLADQGPVLSFNTFNKCIHTFADPGIEDSSLDLYQGRGYEGDYEFGIISLEEGTQYALLKGKKRETYVRMVRLADDTDFESYLTDINVFKDRMFSSEAPNNDKITLGDTTFVFTRASKGIAELYPVGGDPITENSYHAYTLAKHDGQYYIRFRDKIGRGNCDAQEFAYNASDDKFYEASNQNYVISSMYDQAFDFLKEKYDEGRMFKVYRGKTTELSAKMQQYLADASEGMAAVNKAYKIDSVVLKKNDNQAFWQFKYQKSSSAQFVAYKYDVSIDNNVMAFNFIDAEAINGTNIMNRVPAVKTLMTEVLSRRFIVDKYETLFFLREIKFTAEDDPELWFIIHY